MLNYCSLDAEASEETLPGGTCLLSTDPSAITQAGPSGPGSITLSYQHAPDGIAVKWSAAGGRRAAGCLCVCVCWQALMQHFSGTACCEQPCMFVNYGSCPPAHVAHRPPFRPILCLPACLQGQRYLDAAVWPPQAAAGRLPPRPPSRPCLRRCCRRQHCRPSQPLPAAVCNLRPGRSDLGQIYSRTKRILPRPKPGSFHFGDVGAGLRPGLRRRPALPGLVPLPPGQ